MGPSRAVRSKPGGSTLLSLVLLVLIVPIPPPAATAPLRAPAGSPIDLPPPAPQGVRAYAGNHRVSLRWRPHADTTGSFSHYAIYRQVVPFSSVSGSTPLHTITGVQATSWEDASALNGVGYHYAVTAVFTDGAETVDVTSVGPRTPFDETDLQVVSIARTPRFPRFDPIYTYREISEPSGFGPYVFSAATGLGSGQTPATRRWPDVGDPVTWTATIRNRGTNPWNGPLTGMWRVDGLAVAAVAQPASLPPGATTAVSLVRTWDGQLHTIEFELDLADARDSNDRLSTQTLSVGFLSYVDRTRIEEFREETPSYPDAASNDFLDWLNLHMARFNGMFLDAGTAKRVHFDVLEALDDDAPDPAIDRTPFAIFPFRYRMGEGSLRLSGYYDPAEDLDYGLLHEMGHQLGLIDLYRLDVAPAQNQVSSLPYRGPECLMNGSSHSLSTSSRDAMTHWLHQAHGYYGQYLYAIPSQVRMRFLGFDGLPLVNAAVTVYQKVERPGLGEVITAQVKFHGLTDAEGVYPLPNVPIDPALVPPSLVGDTLRPNPFGYVAVIGNNGVLHFRIEHGGSSDYAWLDITETNAAYRAGETEQATFVRQVALGGAIQQVPPPDMAELNQGSWARWAEAGTLELFDDPSFSRVGTASIRIEASGGFDNYWRYPNDRIAQWDLSTSDTLYAWFHAINPNSPQFQNRSPWVFLRSANGSIELHPTTDVLDAAIGRWVEIAIPLAGDATWIRTTTGSPDLTRISGLEIHADTWGAGFTLWMDGVRFSPSPPSGMGGPTGPPPTLALAPPRPNPFGDRTMLDFEVPAPGAVDMGVFDAGGRRIRTLVSDPIPAGRHRTSWDGRDHEGRTAPNGVYFVRLTGGMGEITRKLVKAS